MGESVVSVGIEVFTSLHLRSLSPRLRQSCLRPPTRNEEPMFSQELRDSSVPGSAPVDLAKILVCEEDVRDNVVRNDEFLSLFSSSSLKIRWWTPQAS
jgi:hypothetical protein